MVEKGIVVEGFYFVDEKVAEQARREAEGVKYIKENMNLENQEAVMQMYHKLLTEELFETPIGLGFLKELRDYLRALPSVDELELEVISTEPFFREKEVETVKKEKVELPEEEQEDTLKQTKKRMGISVLVNVFLVIVVIGMMIISLTGNNPNILNYENKILDKYAQWQQELTEREQVIREKEKELEITP